MKKILFLLLFLTASISYGQMTPLGGNTPTLGGSPGAGGGGGGGANHLGTANRVTVTGTSTTPIFSTPQDSHTGADVTYASLTLSGLLDGILSSTAGVITGGAGVNLTSDVSGILPIANGGTNSSTALNNDRLMLSSAGAVVEAGALTNGQMFIGSTGAAPSVAGLTGTANQVSIANGAGSITLSTPQDIHTGASPTFLSATFSGLTASEFIKTDGASGLTTVTNIDLTSDITGILPIANGGTNSSTALNNDRLLLTVAGSIVESAALIDGQIPIGSTGGAPSFSTITGTANQVSVANGSGSVTLSTPQDIHTGAAPTFTGATLSGLAASQFVVTDGSSALAATPTIPFASITGVVPIASGGTNSSTALNNDRLLLTAGGAIVEANALLDGQFLVGATGGAPAGASITGTVNQVTVTNGSNSIVLALPQDLHSGASPTFASLNSANLTLSGNQLSSSDVNGDIIIDPDNAGEIILDGPVTITGAVSGGSTFSDSVITVNDTNTQGTADANNAGLLVSMTDATNAGLFYDSALNSFFSIGEVGAEAEVVTVSNNQTLTNKTIASIDNIVEADTVRLEVRNVTGVLIPKGSLVYAENWNNGQGVAEVNLADSDGTGTTPVVGVVTADISNNSNGEIVVSGYLTGLSTTGFATGDILYLSTTPGAFTNVRPTGTGELVQSIGAVGRVHASLGTILVQGAGRTDEVPNDITVNGPMTFPNLTVSKPLVLDGAGVVTSQDVSLTSQVTGILPIANGGTNSATALSNNRHIISSGDAIVESAAATDGQLLVGATGGTLALASISATANQTTVTNGSNTISIGTVQDIATGSSPTFTGGTFSGLTANQFVTTDGSSALQSTATIDFASITGIVPIAQGGTNSGTALNGSRMMLSTATQVVEGAALTDGQIFIGQTGGAPTGAALTGTANQVNIANASGSITLSTPQDIHAAATPTFASATFSLLADGFVKVANNGELYTSVTTGVASVDLASEVFGILPIANGGTNSGTALSGNRMLVTNASSIVESAAATDGQLLIGSTGSAPSVSGIAGTANQVTVTNGSGSISLSLPQDIHTGASPTFTGATLSGLTANQFVFTDGASALVSVATIDFASVTGIVPVAQGGTNSSAALTNGKLLHSVGDAIVEDAELITNNTEAALEISSTTKGFILPRMTEAQRDAITAEAGMHVYNTDINQSEYYNGTGWISY